MTAALITTHPRQIYTCLAADAKTNPMVAGVGVDVDALLFETDTNNSYRFAGTTWAQFSTNQSLHVNMQAGVWTYGNWPATWWLSWSGAAGAADNSVIYTSGDVSMYDYHIIENTSGETMDIFVSVDGTNFTTAAAAVELIDDVTTGGGVKSITIPTTKTAILRGKYKKIRVDQNGAGVPAAGEVRGAHGVE